jgi:hypothetical protein
MKTIWKFPVPEFGPFDLQMPKDAQILDVQTQVDSEDVGGVLWALVEPQAEPEIRRFMACFTGKECPLPEHSGHVATVQYMDGRIVAHYFELP